ncbi:hypothetical protein WJX73_007949 [Symbiochloris irregularis]|uniref:Uncharacterized protein n=1 Tax=Symbiochloris irregularis TaxID=706552 RepID=A0AAW1Q2N0_9CHLO
MSDKILYALVARGQTVLAECSTVAGNANLVAHRILEKLPTADNRVSYTQEQHVFHVVTAEGFTFLCMADQGLGRRIPFSFLEEIKHDFLARFQSQAQTAAAYELDGQYSPHLEERLNFFSNDRNADTINRVRGEISEVRKITVENIEKVLERGERLELLVDKTDHLQSEALIFKRQSRQLKNKLWWRNARLLALVLGVVVLAAYVVAAVACGPLMKRC